MNLCFSCIALILAATPVRWMDLGELEREAAMRELSAKPLGTRLLDASGRFLGTPYTVSPLGEGTGKDADPLIRFDAVDCLTFVEETMAISYAADPRGVEPILSELRDVRGSAFDARNHLMEAQWLHPNVGKGF